MFELVRWLCISIFRRESDPLPASKLASSIYSTLDKIKSMRKIPNLIHCCIYYTQVALNLQYRSYHGHEECLFLRDCAY